MKQFLPMVLFSACLNCGVASAQSWLSCVEALTIPVVSSVGAAQMKGANQRDFEFTFGIDSSGVAAVPKGHAPKIELSLAYIVASSVVSGQLYRKQCGGKIFTLKVRIIRLEAGTGRQASRVFPDNRASRSWSSETQRARKEGSFQTKAILHTRLLRPVDFNS